jgi:hypothetical protein
MPLILPLRSNSLILCPLFVVSSAISSIPPGMIHPHPIHHLHRDRNSPILILHSQYIHQLWQFSVHLVTCVALVACAVNASVLSLHGDEAPPAMIASLLRLTPLLMECRVWMSLAFGYSSHSPSMANSIRAPLFIGILVLEMRLIMTQACGLSKWIKVRAASPARQFSTWILLFVLHTSYLCMGKAFYRMVLNQNTLLIYFAISMLTNILTTIALKLHFDDISSFVPRGSTYIVFMDLADAYISVATFTLGPLT